MGSERAAKARFERSTRRSARGFSASDPGPGEWFFRVPGHLDPVANSLSLSLSLSGSCIPCSHQTHHNYLSRTEDW